MGAAKIFLIVINIIFMLAGIGILIPGILFLADVTFATDEIKPVAESVEVSGFKLSDLLNNMSIAFICAGVFVFLVSILGLAGACCVNKCLLATYAVIVILLFLMQITMVVLYSMMSDTIDSKMKKTLTDDLITNYQFDELDSDHSLSNAYNTLFMKYKCCTFSGVTGRVNDFDTSPWCMTTGTSKCFLGVADIPKSCCKAVTRENYAQNHATCTQGLNDYYDSNCYDAIKAEIADLSKAAIAVGAIGLVIEILAIIASIYMCCTLNSGNKVV